MDCASLSGGTRGSRQLALALAAKEAQDPFKVIIICFEV